MTEQRTNQPTKEQTDMKLYREATLQKRLDMPQQDASLRITTHVPLAKLSMSLVWESL